MSGNEVQHELNRLAYGVSNPLNFRDEQRAANDWAGTSGLSLVGALNAKALNTGTAIKDLQGVCNQLAGTSGLGPPEALSRL
jgi:hypothetical protein